MANDERLRSALAEGAVYVTWARPERYEDGDQQARLRGLLDADELARADRFRFDRDRMTFVAAHALVRRTLSQVEPMAPDAWRFVANEHGRPEVAAPGPTLRFNLSHTRGLVACAVTRRADVGVDVEFRPRRVEIERLARSVLTDTERQDLGARDAAAQRRRFFEYWTLKEAYLKAVGLGFALSPRKLTFFPDVPGAPRVRFDGHADTPASWCFRLQEPTEDHQLALAVRGARARVLAATETDL